MRSLEAACDSAASMDVEEPPPERTSHFEEVLERSAHVSAVWRGPAFRFRELPSSSGSTIVVTGGNAHLLSPPLDAWREDVARGVLLCAVVVGDQAVSVCASVRQTAVVHEAGVETAPAFRGKGHAVDAVMAWAAAVMRLNRVPLYSTSWGNVASLALARKLGLVQYASDLHIT